MRASDLKGYGPVGSNGPKYSAAPPPAEQASGELLDKPLKVFSDGEWKYAETGQSFSAADLDEAAFVVYRDRLAAIDATAALSQRPVVHRKYPDDGNGDDDAYNRGWNECLAALAPQQPEKGEAP